MHISRCSDGLDARPRTHATGFLGHDLTTERFAVPHQAAGVQCTPSEDNVVDCLPACMEKVRESYPGALAQFLCSLETLEIAQLGWPCLGL